DVYKRQSPLYRRLVIEEKKLLELSSWAGEHSKDPGLFVIEATLRPPDGSASPSLFDPIIDAIQEEFDRIANNQIPAQRITQVKEHLLYATPMQLETPSSVAYLLASMLALSESIEDIRDFYRYLSEITPAEVAECARRHLVPSHRYVVTLRGPKEGEPK
ncbi:MAG: hypothetical protein N2515_00780, partial [Deltaproteobacteria bacterium]|nr:hypothetical protein [Deltaproteobacteria bacterium]